MLGQKVPEKDINWPQIIQMEVRLTNTAIGLIKNTLKK